MNRHALNACNDAPPAAGLADPTRRAFLKTSAVAGGGLLIALSLPSCGRGPRGLAGGPDVPVQPNAWLRIDTDGSIVFLSGRSEMGQGVYTALPTIIAEELEVPVELIRVEAAPAGDLYTNELLGVQVTGASTSVREAWEKLRRAGAEARIRLTQAAADEWGVEAATLRAENGAIISADGESLTYGQLASAAAALPVPEKVPLKPADEFTQIGKDRRRLDTPAKVDGSAGFGIDIRLPGMLYGALAQSSVLGGQVASFDAAVAEGMSGVRQVVQTTNGVVVLADTWWQAKQARDALPIEWSPGANANLDNAAIRARLKNALETRAAEAQVAREDGDADAALSRARRRIEAIYELPLLAHATLEPQNCTAQFVDGDVHVYVPTQVQQSAQAAAAAAAGLPPERAHVHTTFLGGGFGRRLESDFVPDAVEAARAAGAPVKLLWSREDDTTHDYYRPPAYDRCTAGFGPDGSLVAWKFEICSPSITSRWAPAVLESMIDPFAIEAAANYPYDVPNVHVAYLQEEIGINVGYWRSVSHATNCFVAESFMDELAHVAGRDPYEFRRALLERQPESRWLGVLERAAERAGWGKAAASRHQGIALMEGYGTYMAQVAEIEMRGGKAIVHKVVCAADCGQMINPSIVTAQIQSGIIFGLSAALWGEITLEGGRVVQQNYDTFRILRMNEVPEIDVMLVDSDAEPGGMGEPSTALVAPAVANALFAATGQRLRSLPLERHGYA